MPHAVVLLAIRREIILPAPAHMAAAYDSNKQLEVGAQTHTLSWSKDAQPDGYPDEINMDFGLTEKPR